MYIIENDRLEVQVQSRGAELQRIFDKKHGLEYLWSGDPAFWGKKSPVLFPIVGALKDDTYYFQGRPYTLTRHGFARDKDFRVRDQRPGILELELVSDESTLLQYPFFFQLVISYRLEPEGISVGYTVRNQGGSALYFSVGGHPAFRVPLAEGTGYSNYYLEFDSDPFLDRWPISPQGLIEKEPRPFSMEENIIPLSRELFYEDALVFKRPGSTRVSLRSGRTAHGLDVDFSGFDYLGIWAARNADFVCIEPWCGIADSVDADQQLIHKEGINKLGPGEIFERVWKVSFY